MITRLSSTLMSVTVKFEKDGIVTNEDMVTSATDGIIGGIDTDNIKRILQNKYKGSIIKIIEIKQSGCIFL